MKSLDQIFSRYKKRRNKYPGEENEEKTEERLRDMDSAARRKAGLELEEPKNKRKYPSGEHPPGKILPEEVEYLDYEFPYDPEEGLRQGRGPEVDEKVAGGVPKKPEEWPLSKLNKQNEDLENKIYWRLDSIQSQQEYPTKADKEVREIFELIKNFTVNKFNKQKFQIKKQMAVFRKVLEDNRVHLADVPDFEENIVDIFQKINSPYSKKPDFSQLDEGLDNFFKNSKTPDFYRRSAELIYKDLKSKIIDCFDEFQKFKERLETKKSELRKKLIEIDFKDTSWISLKIDDLVNEIASFNFD